MKRPPSSPPAVRNTKKPRLPESDNARKQSRLAKAEDAARVDADPPYQQLLGAMETLDAQEPAATSNGECVVYWMRMEDLRIFDNRALSQASEHAQALKVPLVSLFIHSPEDYVAHDRGARRIDFVLRNLKLLKKSFDRLNIPFTVLTHATRRSLPDKVLSLVSSDWRAVALFANIEHEVDELRRDIRVLELLRRAHVQCTFVHDRCVVPPGLLETKAGKQYAVYSPWLKEWSAYVNKHLDSCTGHAPDPRPNDISVKEDARWKGVFESTPVDVLEGWECADKKEMEEYWPAGTDAALQMIERFFHCDSTPQQLGAVDPLRVKPGTYSAGSGDRGRLECYDEERDHADRDSTSRISPYLAAGVVPTRALIRAVMGYGDSSKMDASRGSGPGVWTMELAWRDFYTHVMAAFPRVSMGRPFLEKYAAVKWETNEEHLQAWKDGMTGVPIVDAGMRQLKNHGWMHNRLRMITAMYLVKDLMLDWRLGELHFSHLLMDADLASNNGGWQWSASTGTDPQPYFRIFNPYLQAEKADPTGDFIRHYVPELSHLKGKSLQDPFHHLSPKEFEKLKYPQPLVEHSEARDRALRRYKFPGEK
ncbi:hypothetical protein AURDEDRAFT_141740 [Auricularia subglabra TFB-10046 SS5]|nr:hypothetical protein AURDEDRAFT_141740 [Auricularia subglabra TFB-10046 SS5]